MTNFVNNNLNLKVMAEDNEDGFNPDAMKAAKKEEIDKLSISIDNSEQVLNEFKFLTQVFLFGS